jgi:hypothetical protein
LLGIRASCYAAAYRGIDLMIPDDRVPFAKELRIRSARMQAASTLDPGRAGQSGERLRSDEGRQQFADKKR